MLLYFIIACAIACIALLMAIILGDYGPWYLSWFLGTGFMVLAASAAGVLFEAQDDAEKKAGGDGGAPATGSDLVKTLAEPKADARTT